MSRAGSDAGVFETISAWRCSLSHTAHRKDEPIPPGAQKEQRSRHAPASSARWQLAVGLFVAIGCLATAGYAFVENFWG